MIEHGELIVRAKWNVTEKTTTVSVRVGGAEVDVMVSPGGMITTGSSGPKLWDGASTHYVHTGEGRREIEAYAREVAVSIPAGEPVPETPDAGGRLLSEEDIARLSLAIMQARTDMVVHLGQGTTAGDFCWGLFNELNRRVKHWYRTGEMELPDDSAGEADESAGSGKFLSEEDVESILSETKQARSRIRRSLTSLDSLSWSVISRELRWLEDHVASKLGREAPHPEGSQPETHLNEGREPDGAAQEG